MTVQGFDIDKVFTYHPPFGNQADRYVAIRGSAKAFAKQMQALCPPSAELTLALRRVQEAVMYANASIAINEE